MSCRYLIAHAHTGNGQLNGLSFVGLLGADRGLTGEAVAADRGCFVGESFGHALCLSQHVDRGLGQELGR